MPSRFPETVLVQERKALGSSGYAGQMQQRPAPATGDRFKREWWRFWSPTGEMQRRPTGCSQVPPKRFHPAIDHIDEVIQSWDLAFKGNESSDPVVGLVLARIGANKFLLEMKRGQWGFTETRKHISQMSRDWPKTFEKLVEDKANGSAIIEALSGEIPGIVAVEPKGGKESRAAAIEPQIEAGNVYLPEGAEWLDILIDEFAAFPKGKHDDIVDAMSQGLVKLTEDSDVHTARALLGLLN